MFFLTGIALGMAIHFKIYPIIFTLPLYSALSGPTSQNGNSGDTLGTGGDAGGIGGVPCGCGGRSSAPRVVPHRHHAAGGRPGQRTKKTIQVISRCSIFAASLFYDAQLTTTGQQQLITVQ